MHIRPLEVADHAAALDLLTQTFEPFFEGYVRPLLGETVFRHQHGHWQQDYRDELPSLHSPATGRRAAVATLDNDRLVGLISWQLDTTKAHHGEIYLLAVAAPERRQHVGRDLCEHALAHMRSSRVEVVEIGTGGDPFHAPARLLYEQLGFTQIPVAAYLRSI